MSVTSESVSIQNPVPSELVEKIPAVEQRGKVPYLKADMVHDVFSSGRETTEGQAVMGKMMIGGKSVEDFKTLSVDELKASGRPAGYAIGFATEPTMPGQNLGRNLFEEGTMILTSSVVVDGGVSYVGVDKDGVFLLQVAEGKSRDVFLQSMRDQFAKVGNQEDGFVVKTDLNDEANARKWDSGVFKIVPIAPEKVSPIIQAASQESLKAPYISPKDMEISSKKNNRQEDQPVVPEPEKLSDISF
jgi:hypothetical protein